MSDILGRKRTLLLATTGFIAASVLGGLADSFLLLVVARAMQGFFGALLAPATLSLMATTFTDRTTRGTAFGIFGAVSSSGSAIGLLLGGALTEYPDWRWCLLVNVLVGAVILAGASAAVPAQPAASDRPRLDLPGPAHHSTPAGRLRPSVLPAPVPLVVPLPGSAGDDAGHPPVGGGP